MLADAPSGVPQVLPPELMCTDPAGDVVWCSVDSASLLTTARQLSSYGPVVGCNLMTVPGGCMYWERSLSTAAQRCRNIIFLSPHCLYKDDQFRNMLKHVVQGMRIIFLTPMHARLPEALEAMVVRNFVISAAANVLAALVTNTISIGGEGSAFQRVRGAVVPRHAVALRVFPNFASTQTEALEAPAPDAVAFETNKGVCNFYAGQMVRASSGLMGSGVPRDLLGVIECFRNGWPVVRFASDVLLVVHTHKTAGKKAKTIMPLLPSSERVTIRDIQELPCLPANWSLILESAVGTRPDIQHLLPHTV